MGSGLASVNGQGPEPALIDPSLRIDPVFRRYGSSSLLCHRSYARCSPKVRAAYQAWLRTDRCDPKTAPGLVLLYFYGLERRALHDAAADPGAAADLPDIRRELARLLAAYRHLEDVRECVARLGEFLAVGDLPAKGYLQPPLATPAELTPFERMALAQCAQDGAPLPAAWALRWVQQQRPALSAQVCARFQSLYPQRHGAGLRLSREAGSRLRLSYRPASPTFQGVLACVTRDTPLCDPGEVPKALRVLLEEVLAADMALGRVEQGRVDHGRVEVNSRTPALVSAERPSVARAQRRVREGRRVAVPLADLLKDFPDLGALTLPQRHWRLSLELASLGVGMVPDPRFGDRPARTQSVVLFSDVPDGLWEAPPAPGSALYQAVLQQVCLALAVMPGARAGRPAAVVQAYLEGQPLNASERRRLGAHLHLARIEPFRVADLPPCRLTGSDWDQAVALLTQVVRSHVIRSSPAGTHVSFPVQAAFRDALRWLGVKDSDRVAAALLAAGDAPVPSPAVVLDADKVATLREEQARLEAVLGAVFAEGAADTAAPPSARTGAGCLGLDAAATGFLTALLGRSEWPRASLERLAQERGLPLDGVLERLNEACYERLDMPLFEEGNPLVLLPEAVAGLGGGTGGSGIL